MSSNFSPSDVQNPDRKTVDASREMMRSERERAEKENQTSASAKVQPTLRSIVAKFSEELGGQPELIRQCLADLNQSQREEVQRAFDARIEYSKGMAIQCGERETAMKEYGLQTLKWLFLMNAGAVALLAAYIGARFSRSYFPIETIISAMLPFAAGCFLVAVGGAAAYFNFGYATHLSPSQEHMYNFMNVHRQPAEWPKPRGARSGEEIHDTYVRVGMMLSLSRWIAVGAGISSLCAFGLGLLIVWRTLT